MVTLSAMDSLVKALDDEVLDWQYKAIPASFDNPTAAELIRAHPPLSQFSTPLLTLSEPELEHNARLFARWCQDAGVELAPHGKTTMAPQLWAKQLHYGAWGITVATAAQLRVAEHFGVPRVMLANTLSDPEAISYASELAEAGKPVWSWVGSLTGVEILNRALEQRYRGAQEFPQLPVLVELGAPGGRTGARTSEQAHQVAQAIIDSPYLALSGVGGYEGALAHDRSESGLSKVRAYLTNLRDLHEALLAQEAYQSEEIVVSAGGSAYFDDVAAILAPLAQGRVRVVQRSGAYLIHDDGFYRGISPLSSRSGARGETELERGDTGEASHSELQAAMHLWARVSDVPEPGLAILDFGKRDAPYDEGLPEPQYLSSGLGEPMHPLHGAHISAMNDQHAFLRFGAQQQVQVGQVVRLGLSHPCTAFDKWTLIPVISQADKPEEARVTGLVRTFF